MAGLYCAEPQEHQRPIGAEEVQQVLAANDGAQGDQVVKQPNQLASQPACCGLQYHAFVELPGD